MNQLFYNIAGGIVHQIRREKRTTISEVIVRGKRNIKQNRNWFYFKFSVESSSFKLGKIHAYLWRLKQTSLSFVWFYQSVFCQKLSHFTLGQWSESWRRWCWVSFSVVFLFYCLILELSSKGKGRKIVFVLGLVGRVSVCIHYCREIYYFSPR